MKSEIEGVLNTLHKAELLNVSRGNPSKIQIR